MKKFLTICAILILVIVAGVFWFAQNEEVVQNIENINSQEVAQSEEIKNPEIMYNTDGSIDTSNWKTYTNEEHGFSVRYPEEWFFQITEESLFDIATRFEWYPSERQSEAVEKTGIATSFIFTASHSREKTNKNPLKFYQRYFKAARKYTPNSDPKVDRFNKGHAGNTTISFNNVDYWIINRASQEVIDPFLNDGKCIGDGENFSMGASLNLLINGRLNQVIGFSCPDNAKEVHKKQLFEIINSFKLLN